MDKRLYFDDIEVGMRWKSCPRTVTELDVQNFAGLTGDYDPLHLDHGHAIKSPFHRPIAHGLLGLSFVAGLGSNFPAIETVAFVSIEDWHFLKPIFFGDTVHVLNEVIDKQQRGRRRGRVRWKRQLINQRNEVVQEGLFETIVAVSSATGRPRLRTQRRGAA